MQVNNTRLLLSLTVLIAAIAFLSAFLPVPFLVVQVFLLALMMSLLSYVLLVLFKTLAAR